MQHSGNISEYVGAKKTMIKWPCSFILCYQCDYIAPTKDQFIKHQESKHAGIRYPCDMCDHQSSTKHGIISHRKRVHEGDNTTVNIVYSKPYLKRL
jgi:hypothetical protein